LSSIDVVALFVAMCCFSSLLWTPSLKIITSTGTTSQNT
jgi:hypothetical protein